MGHRNGENKVRSRLIKTAIRGARRRLAKPRSRGGGRPKAARPTECITVFLTPEPVGRGDRVLRRHRGDPPGTGSPTPRHSWGSKTPAPVACPAPHRPPLLRRPAPGRIDHTGPKPPRPPANPVEGAPCRRTLGGARLFRCRCAQGRLVMAGRCRGPSRSRATHRT